MNRTAAKQALSGLRWLIFALALVIACLFLAWRILAAFDFAYPVLYDALELGQTIERYGPQNDVRPGFHRTDRAERERLFAAIAEAIRSGGEGLAELDYHTPDGRRLGALLTPAEIRHLHDVARLVHSFELMGWSALAVLAALTGWSWWRRERPPRARLFGMGALVLVVVGTVSVVALGPKAVFYWFHEQVFPADHQWFFYYEESLMSMMMRAPDLFGAIAVLWLLLALGLGGLLFVGLERGLRYRARPGDR